MRRLPRKLLFLFFTLVLLPFFARAVSAQPSEGERKSQARILYQEGVKQQEGGNYTEALAKFEAAQKLYNAPTHLLHMAECQAMLGKLIDATENYRVLSRMTLPADAPQAFVAAQQQGAAELPAVEARIPQLKLEIKDPPIATLKNLQITLNGKPVPVELVGVSRPIDPGKYKINAFADGYVIKDPTGEIPLAEKEKRVVQITLQPGTPPPLASASASAAPSSSAPPPASASASATTSSTTPPPPPPPPEKKTLGIMAGAHLNVNKPIFKTSNFVSTGAALGVDLGIKLGRAIYIGGGLEFGRHGTGSAIDNAPANNGAKVDPDNYGISSFYIYPMLAFFSSNDKLGFWADLNAGLRSWSINQSKNADASFAMAAVEVGGAVGAIIPAGPMRLVPRLGVTIGGSTNTNPKVKELGRDVPTTFGLNTESYYDNNGSGVHGMLILGLTGYFSADLL